MNLVNWSTLNLEAYSYVITVISCSSLPYEVPGGVMLSELSSPANKERDIDVYVTVEADHEYEILDKYNQPHVKAPPPKPKPETKTAVQLQPLPSTGDYEFTQCPAYVSVTTTNVIGNASKPLEIPPPSQPGPLTPAQ